MEKQLGDGFGTSGMTEHSNQSDPIQEPAQPEVADEGAHADEDGSAPAEEEPVDEPGAEAPATSEKPEDEPGEAAQAQQPAEELAEEPAEAPRLRNCKADLDEDVFKRP